MDWKTAQQTARKLLEAIAQTHQPEEIRLVLRALQREYHKETTMNIPTIIVSKTGPNSYKIDVSGRFGGGFQGLRTDREGVLSKLAHLKTYDCGDSQPP